MALQKELLEINAQLKKGGVPNVLHVMYISSCLDILCSELIPCIISSFMAKEKAELDYKMELANQMSDLRQKKYTIADANAKAMITTYKLKLEQIKKEADYDRLRMLYKSLDNSMQVLRSLKTTIEKGEYNTL